MSLSPPSAGAGSAGARSGGPRGSRPSALRGWLVLALLGLLALLLPVGAVAVEREGAARGATRADWPLHNGDFASTRAAAGTRITAVTVGRLEVAWRLPFTSRPGLEGIFASAPLVVGGIVYALDLDSRHYAADLHTGRLLWTRSSHARNSGPNGVGYADGRIAGITDTYAYAVNAVTGRQVWATRLARQAE